MPGTKRELLKRPVKDSQSGLMRRYKLTASVANARRALNRKSGNRAGTKHGKGKTTPAGYCRKQRAKKCKLDKNGNKKAKLGNKSRKCRIRRCILVHGKRSKQIAATKLQALARGKQARRHQRSKGKGKGVRRSTRNRTKTKFLIQEI